MVLGGRWGGRRSAPALAVSPTTTNALATRSRWSRSGSTAPRSPTAPTRSSWPTPAPSRRCTGRPDSEGGWSRTAMGRAEPLDLDQPVVHVSWHEADAFARWAGKRLPTEQEWEVAAEGADRERANLDQLAFGCAEAGAYGDAPSDCGAVQMLGDVWEWTSSDFIAYPGFQRLSVPRVLRGLLRRRPQGAARRLLGDPPQRDPDQLPQLGPPRATPDLRRSALRAGRLNRRRREPVPKAEPKTSQEHEPLGTTSPPSESRSTSTCRPGGRCRAWPRTCGPV